MDPTVMVAEQIWLRIFLIRLQIERVEATLAGIEAAWNALFPAYVMEFEFLDDLYQRL